MKKIVCEQHNAKEFKEQLRLTCPAAFELVKVLYAARMIQGVRGMVLELFKTEKNSDSGAKTVQAVQSVTCQHCQHWQRDKIGDGTGMGDCSPNTNKKQLKWPHTEACKHFKEIC